MFTVVVLAVAAVTPRLIILLTALLPMFRAPLDNIETAELLLPILIAVEFVAPRFIVAVPAPVLVPVLDDEDGDTVKVKQTPETFSLDQWQQWASPVWPVNWSEIPDTWRDPVWMDIDQQETLNGERGRRDARDEEDEKHICPLQLPTIRRLVKMYSNPGEVVLSPFLGIGSEGYVSLQERRKFVGVELKGSYFRTAAANLASIENTKQASLFGAR
jgi:hypothetical protein